MTNTPEQAIAAARNQAANGPRIDRWLGTSTYTGWCLKAVRTCYGVSSRDFTPVSGRDPLAVEAYQYASNKHPEANPSAIPRGVPVFWRGGSTGAGHIAISTGAGLCWSTDIRRPGYFDKVPISEIGVKWGMTLLGWTEDLNGVRVWTAPPPPPAPAKETPVSNRWTRTRARLLAALNHEDAQGISKNRVAIRAFLALTRRGLRGLPKE